MHSPKGKIVQFDQFPVIPLRMLSSKAVLSPDMSPMAPNHQSPSHATFSTTMRKNCKEIDSELKKSETAMKRQSMDYLRALAMLPRFQFRENSQLQSKQDIFKAARNFNEKNKPSVSRNQMIYRTDDPEFVLNLTNLRKSNFENKPKREILGKIYVTEFWDKNHHQNIVTNAKLLDKARHTGKYQARKSFVNFQEIIEKRMIIEERKNKKGVSPLSEGNIFMGVENYQDLMKNPNSLVNFSSTVKKIKKFKKNCFLAERN